MLLDNKNFITKQDEEQIEVRITNSKKPFYLKKDEYYSKLAQFIEIIKVEGYWNEKGNLAICNKSVVKPVGNTAIGIQGRSLGGEAEAAVGFITISW